MTLQEWVDQGCGMFSELCVSALVAQGGDAIQNERQLRDTELAVIFRIPRAGLEAVRRVERWCRENGTAWPA